MASLAGFYQFTAPRSEKTPQVTATFLTNDPDSPVGEPEQTQMSEVESYFGLEVERLPLTSAQQEICERVGLDHSKWSAFTFSIPAHLTSFDRLQMTWQAIASSNPTLRTVLVKKLSDSQAYQVILRKATPIRFSKGPSETNCPYLVYSEDEKKGVSTFTLHIHPALMDAASTNTVQNDFELFYNGYSPPCRIPFHKYVHHILSRNESEALDYWHQTFDSFRSKPLFEYVLQSDERVLTTVEVPLDLATRLDVFNQEHNRASQTLLQAAWSIVLSRHLDMEDIAFSTTLRDTEMEGADSIIGCLDVNVDLRIQVNPESQVLDFILAMENATESAQKFGFVDRRKRASLIPSLRYIQTSFRTVGSGYVGSHRSFVTSDFDVELNLATSHLTSLHSSGIPTERVRLVLHHVSEAIEQIIQHPLTLVKDINLVSPLEKQKLLAMGRAEVAVPALLVHEIIESQSRIRPNDPAVHFLNLDPMSYSTLNSMANRIARQIAKLSSKGSIIPVYMDVSSHLAVALLAILKSGCAYVILDPAYPQDRKAFIMEDTKAELCITSQLYKDEIARTKSNLRTLLIDDLTEVPEDDSNLKFNIQVDSPAYIIYTSGSTGNPKGTILSHRAASSGIICAPDLPSFRSLLFYNPVFSAAQRTLLSTLAHGGCLCLASGSGLQVSLSDTVNILRVNNLGITSSTIPLLDVDKVPTLQRITLTGEALDPGLVSRWGDRVELRNNYGLSECTQLNWGESISKNCVNPRVIGRAKDTTSAYVLHPDSTELAPFLVPGELCLSGPQLATGYLNRSELTESVFVQNPFDKGERLYRTGDMALRFEDGSIQIIGRKDFQTKINGQRVEPGEIQSVLRTHTGVDSVLVITAIIADRKSLVACVVSKPEYVWSSLVQEMRSKASALLPTYMLPSYWHQIPSIPINHNGKTDVSALRKIVEQKSHIELLEGIVSREHQTDRQLTEPEFILQTAYSKVLNLPIEMVGMNSSFLSLGGDSLQAINVMSMVLDKGYSISVGDILQTESVSKTAKLAKKESIEHQRAPLEPFSLLPKDMSVDIDIYEDAFPATPLQEAVISAHLSNGTYVYDRIFRIESVDINRLRNSFNEVLKQSSIYRSTFLSHGNSFVQAILKDLELPWKLYEGIELDEMQSLASNERMGLSSPFVRALQLDDRILVVRVHHALFDFWSSRFLFDDVAAVYLQQDLSPRPHFSLFAKSVLELDVGEAKTFWADHLTDAPSTKLVGTTPSLFNASTRSLNLDFRSFTASAGITTGALAYTVWALILWKHTSSQDVTFAITLSGRDVAIQSIQHIDGPTLVTVPLRVQVDPAMSLLDLARYVQGKMWEVAKHSQYGMRKVLQASGHHSGPFDTLVNYLVKNEPSSQTEEVLPTHGEKPIWETGYTTLELEESRDGALDLRLSGDLEPIRTGFILDEVAQVLTTLIEKSAATIRDVELISSNEAEFLQQLSTAANPEPALLQSAFEDIAASQPHRVAIQFEAEESVTYYDLNSRANRLARVLADCGVGPDTLVPICLSKSVEMIVCILAVLKAGGAFVPLDPDNPPQRNNFIVSDVSAKIILTDENYSEIFKDQEQYVSVLDVYDLDVSSCSDANFKVHRQTPDNLAYAIYTSGTTGLPKGVLIPHKSITAGIESIIIAEDFSPSWRNLQFSNYVFDVAIGDIFCTLSVGAILCMAPVDRMLADLAEVINAMEVTRLFLTPTVARLLQPEAVPAVKGLYLAGEPVTPDLVETWTPHCKVMNCYGPTEASILTVVGEIKNGGNSKVIGKPLRNTSGWILDPNSKKVLPYGAIGELCLGGSQLAREYLNRPDATESAFFVQDGQRLYRTGDLARWIPRGHIECFGRKDSQVKINGHRIEIGEIESAILGLNAVHDAAVVVVDIREKSQLVAFCVVNAESDRTSIQLAETHREALALLSISLTSLAPYMIPQIWIPVRALPLLPSGKTDRKGLVRQVQSMDREELQVYSGIEGSSEMKEATTTEEKLLQNIWGSLFGLDPKTISATSAFFAHGGDSISAINLVGKCRGNGYLLTVSDVLAYPLLQDMAVRMRSMTETEQEYEPPMLGASMSLLSDLTQGGVGTHDIQAIWPVVPGIEEFLIRGAEEEQFWQCQTVRKLPADFDFELWKRLTTELTAQNDILRSMWAQDVEEANQWKQIVLKKADIDVEIVVCENEEAKERAIAWSWNSRFHVDTGKAFVHYRLLDILSTGTRELLIKIHHAMYDGTLLRILDDQFRALHRGQSPPRSVEFPKYVGYMSASSQHKQESLAFWNDILMQAPAPFLDTSALNSSLRATATLLQTTDSRVDAFAAQCGVTVPIVFQSAFTLLLARLGGSGDVIYDNLITGRNIDMEDAQTINGNCANFLPFRFKISEDLTVRDLLKHTQNLFWKTTEFGDVNITEIQRALGETRNSAANQALFLFQPFEPVTGAVKHMRWMVMAGSRVQMPIDYGLHLEVSRTSNGYNLKFKYDERVYNSEDAKNIAQSTVDILHGMMAKSMSAACQLF